MIEEVNTTWFKSRSPGGPELTAESRRRLNLLFTGDERRKAVSILVRRCGNNLAGLSRATPVELDRYRFAVLKLSHGSLVELERAVELAEIDTRDLLVESGFPEINDHLSWEPKGSSLH